MNTPILLSIKTVDANEDNIKDVMLRTFSDSTERTTKLFLGNERFEFSGMFVPEISAGEIDVVSDIDGDGHADIIGRDGENVMVYLGDGVGGFTVGPIIELGGTASAQVAVVDFDKDGRSDIVAVRKVPINDFDSFFEVVVLFGDEEYLYSSRLIHALDVASYQPRDIVVGDFNQDEMPDFAVHEAVFYGGGADILSIESHPELIANISAADVDGDGLTDLISSLDVYINTGSGFVGGFGGIDFPTEIRPGEFDGDGLTDLAAIKYGPGDVEDSVVRYTRGVD